MIYLAPLQGFTDYNYRQAYSRFFCGVSAYYIPYISLKNNLLPQKHKDEVLLKHNPQPRVIPQVLVKNEDEIITLSRVLSRQGYKEINFNLGCPYPMVTNRGKGAGLLPYPEKIASILAAFFENSELKLSVKMRVGLTSADEIEKVILVLNKFPLTEVIVHPRIAKQLYHGTIDYAAIQFVLQNSGHDIVYNGDIYNTNDFRNLQHRFPEVNNWMIGRGILKNPFLPSEIMGMEKNTDHYKQLYEFHQAILEGYTKILDNSGNVLTKMKQFWIYFSHNFTNPQKAIKTIKKTKNINVYNAQTEILFKSGDLIA